MQARVGLRVPAFALELGFRFGDVLSGFAILSCRQGCLRFSFCFLKFLLRWRRLLVAIIVVVVTSTAAHFRSLPLDYRHNRVVRYAPAFHAVIINYIA